MKKCWHCGSEYMGDLDLIPVFGEWVRCAACNRSFYVMKPNEFYQTNFSKEIALYIQHRQRNQLVDHLEQDVAGITQLEQNLASNNMTLRSVTRSEVNQFLKNQNTSTPSDSLGQVLMELFDIMVLHGMILVNPMVDAKKNPFASRAKTDVSKEIALYIQHRKESGSVALLEEDLEWLQTLERHLVASGQTIQSTTLEEISQFLKRYAPEMTNMDHVVEMFTNYFDVLKSKNIIKHNFFILLGNELLQTGLDSNQRLLSVKKGTRHNKMPPSVEASMLSMPTPVPPPPSPAMQSQSTPSPAVNTPSPAIQSHATSSPAIQPKSTPSPAVNTPSPVVQSRSRPSSAIQSRSRSSPAIPSSLMPVVPSKAINYPAPDKSNRNVILNVMSLLLIFGLIGWFVLSNMSIFSDADQTIAKDNGVIDGRKPEKLPVTSEKKVKMDMKDYFYAKDMKNYYCREYMKTECSSTNTVVNPMPANQDTILNGGLLYGKHCERCHGKNGRGNGPDAIHLDVYLQMVGWAGNSVFEKDAFLFWIIAEGGKGFGGSMPSYKESLSEHDIWKVIHFMETLR
ncbi:MAG: c-type cytochrome [Magnetococcus sp. YQC-5]